MRGRILLIALRVWPHNVPNEARDGRPLPRKQPFFKSLQVNKRR